MTNEKLKELSHSTAKALAVYFSLHTLGSEKYSNEDLIENIGTALNNFAAAIRENTMITFINEILKRLPNDKPQP